MKKLLTPLGVLLLLAITAPLGLADSHGPSAAQAVGAANTAWIMTATALVLFMTMPGLALFYGGLVQKKNVLSVLMHCFAMTCILSVVWLEVGYTVALGGEGQFYGGFGALFGKGLDSSGPDGEGIPDDVAGGIVRPPTEHDG